MGKALKTVGVIIGGAALIATGVGALAMPALAGSTTLFGVSVGTLNTISSGLVAVGGMLDKPKSQGSAAPDEWTSNPDQPIPFLMGRMGVAGKIVQRDEFGPDNMYQGIVGIISGAGPIRGVNGFAGDKQPVTFGANGIAVTSQWEGEMWMVRRAGNQPDTALAVPNGLKIGGAAFEWSPAARLSGKACYLQVLGENSKGTAYPAGIPDPVHDAEGIFGYDPRYDDTYPGGAGPCRLGVRSTYRWINDGGIGALNWALGLVENGQVVGGIGASIDGIDVPAFVEVANIADANGWTLSAWPDTSEDASAVLDQLLQAAGAVRARHAGKISCVSRGAPRASVATITARDTAGDIELDTAPSLFNRLNTITPRFMSEAAGWVMTPANPVSFPQYVTDDGGKHGDQIDYRFVSSLKQAAELAAYDILDAREPFSGTIPLKAHMRHLKRGDTFDIDEPGFLMDGVKCIVLSRSYDPKTAQVRLGFRSETDSKHPLALGKTTTLPAFPELTPTDPTFVTQPFPEDWIVTPRPPSEDGTQQPGFDLTGLVSNATATAVIVEWGAPPTEPLPDPLPVGTTLADYIAWEVAYQGPPDVQRIPITGLQSGQTYYIAVRYQRDQNFSKRYVYGPYEAPTLKAGISDETIQDIVRDVVEKVDGIATGRDEAEKVAEVVLETILNEQDSLEREAAERLNADTGVLNEARSHTDGKVAEAMNLVYTKAETDAGAASTLQAAKSYTDGKQSEAQLLFSTKTERANGDATAVIQAKAYTDDYKTQASLTFATQVAMGQANAETLSTAQSYSDGKLATALNTVYTKAQTDSAISTTLQQARSYSDDKAAEATLLYSTKTERANGDASTLQSAKSYTDDYKSTAALTFATQSSLNDVTATAALALSTSQDAASKLNEARIRIVADAQGGQPALVEIVSSTSAGSYIRLGAQQIGFGDNTVFDDATDTLQTVINGRRRVLALGAPFGQAGDLIEWWGPSNISLGSMTTGNGDNGRMTASPYVFDNTLASAFSASANTGFIGGARSGAGNVQTSNSVTVTVSGGTAGATIRWVRLTGDSRINMNDPTGFTTGAYATIGVGEVISAYFMGAVTKSGKSAVVYVQVDLSDNGT